jgi:broad specificity phosphatase PhoE
MDQESKIGSLLMYLVRHCLVDLDTEELIRGTQNVDLNKEGEEEAMELRDFFKDKPIWEVYSDDLARTYQTAVSIAEPHRLKVEQDVLLRSWDVGSDLEGRSIEANKWEVRKLKMQPTLHPVGGESWAECEARAAQALAKYTAIAIEAPAPIVLVLHGSLLQLLWKMMGMEDPNAHEYDSTPIEPSGVIAVYLGRNGYRARILREAKEAVDA